MLVKNTTIKITKLLAATIIVGISGGIIGEAFRKTVEFATSIRTHYGFILFLLPVGALLSVALNRLLKTYKFSTNSVIKSTNDNERVNPLLLPAIFISSVITHLFGGSAGREGAALQMGGGAASFITKLFGMSDDDGNTLTICGMAAFFAALFGTPIGACVFALEVTFNKNTTLKAIIPTVISSFIAFAITLLLGSSPERFDVANSEINLSLLFKAAVIAITAAVVGSLFCGGIKLLNKLLRSTIKNEYLLIFIGSVIIVILTLAVGNQDYNGSGDILINRVFDGNDINIYDFALKALFTILTVAIGLKGGEIVPSLSIGATLGGFLSTLLGIDPTIGGAIGMAAIFNSITKCPLASLLICLELFGITALPICGTAIILSCFISSQKGLYKSKQNRFSLLQLIKKA